MSKGCFPFSVDFFFPRSPTTRLHDLIMSNTVGFLYETGTIYPSRASGFLPCSVDVVLKFNNKFSLCFRILCNSIYVERTKKTTQIYIYLPAITLIVHP